MKLNRAEKAGDNTFEMEIVLEPAEFKEAISKAYHKEAKNYNVPGFRKGHAPRNLIEKMYGQDVFYVDAVNELFPTAYEQALEDTKIDPIDQPEVEAEEMSEEKGAVLTVKVLVKPELEVKKYKGLAVDRIVDEVEQPQIDAEIGRLRERNSRLITREGPAEDGDITNIDYEGSVDGVPFDGGKDENFRLTLGSHQFIEGFEEQVVGHSAGDAFDVNVTFPEDYHAEHLAGKPAVFKVKLNQVQYKELPELDDEFAKDVSEFETLKELEDDIRKNLQETLDAHADQEVENRLAEALIETLEGEIPEIMYEHRVNEMVQDFNYRIEQQGLKLETYLQFSGSNFESFKEGFQPQAENLVKMRLALEAVARYENLDVSEEDLDAEVKRISEKYEMPEEDVRKLMPIGEIRKDLLVGKAMEFVKGEAKITDKKPEPPKDDETKDTDEE